MKTKPILVIVMALALLASACVPAQTPTATQPPSATATVVPLGIQEFPDYGGADIAGDEQPAGQYRTPDWYARPFTFETKVAYRGIGEQLPSGALFGLAQGTANLPPKQILFWLVSDSISADEAISMLLSTATLEFGPTETVEVLGTSATQFDGTTDSAHWAIVPAIGTFVGHVGDDWISNSAGVHIRFIVLDVSGQTMVIYIEAPQAEFDDFVKQADEVLATVQFMDPSSAP